MFKTNIFIAVMILACNSIHGTPSNQETVAAHNEQQENQTSSSLGYLKKTWIALGISATACAIAMYITKDTKGHEACHIINPIVTLSVLGTGACAISDTMTFANERDQKAMAFHERSQENELRRLELHKELTLLNLEVANKVDAHHNKSKDISC